MKKNIYIILCLSFVLKIPVFSQSQTPTGLYKIYLNNYGFGYCYIAKDSTFIFCGTNGSTIPHRGNQNNEFIFYDTLTRLGTGKWAIDDSFYVLNFQKSNAVLLNDIRYFYTSYSEKPYDSLLVNINIEIENDTSAFNFLCVLPQIMQPVRRSARISVPLLKSDSILTIIRGNEGPWNFHLSPGNNYHNLTIIFPSYYKTITDHGNVNKVLLIEEGKAICKWY